MWYWVADTADHYQLMVATSETLLKRDDYHHLKSFKMMSKFTLKLWDMFPDLPSAFTVMPFGQYSIWRPSDDRKSSQ